MSGGGDQSNIEIGTFSDPDAHYKSPDNINGNTIYPVKIKTKFLVRGKRIFTRVIFDRGIDWDPYCYGLVSFKF